MNFGKNFNVIHSNGESWTNDEVEDYLTENDSYLLNFYVFAVDTDGYLYALDKCGQAKNLNPDDFKIVWNK